MVLADPHEMLSKSGTVVAQLSEVSTVGRRNGTKAV